MPFGGLPAGNRWQRRHKAIRHHRLIRYPGAGYSDAVHGNDDVRMYFGDAFIAIDANGKMTINARVGWKKQHRCIPLKEA